MLLFRQLRRDITRRQVTLNVFQPKYQYSNLFFCKRRFSTAYEPIRHASATEASNVKDVVDHGIAKKARRGAKYTLIMGGVLGSVFIWDYYFNARTLSRNTRTVWNGIMLILDYKLNYDRDNLEKMNGVHERAAQRLLDVCKKNGGLYVKAGQAIGIQVAILPKPYHALAQMFDAAEPVSLEAIRNVIHDELGMWPEEIFVEFDPNPIGSASIAQVHRARLHTGEQVAVKVQRPDIRKHAKWDLLAFRILMRIYENVFDLPLTFASQYISDQIELETHFDHERENTERIRNHVLTETPKHLKGGVAYVPAIHSSLCTPRLLVMEYIEGAVRMTDVDALEKRLGLDVNEVMNSVCEVFAAQVFKWGFVNADPHPSNVLIRRHPSNPKKHQVVLIDHGLSIPLPPAFRYQYLTLWKSLFTNDTEQLKAVCKAWGVDLGEDGFGAQMMGSAVLLQGWSGPGGRKRRGASQSREMRGAHGGRHGTNREDVNGSEKELTQEERMKRDLEIQRKMKETVKRFLQNYELIPKELIFLGRSMRIIQANNQALGSPVDRISILARGASDSLYEMTIRQPSLIAASSRLSPNGVAPAHQLVGQPSLIRRYLNANVDWVAFRLAIAGMDVAFGRRGLFWGWLWLQRLWWRVTTRLGLLPSRQGRGEEKVGSAEGDFMQQQVMDMAKEYGVEIKESVFYG